MGHDVSEGSKIYGRDLSKCRQSRAKRGIKQISNRYISRSSTPESPPLDDIDQLALVQNTAIGDQCNDEIVTAHDVSLPFPAECWATTSIE